MKTIARSLDCPACGAPITYRAPFCSYCRLPLDWQGGLSLARGASVGSLDLRSPQAELPEAARFGKEVVVRVPEGILVHAKTNSSYTGGLVYLCNGAVRVTGVQIEPSGFFGPVARMHQSGKLRCAYTLSVRPALRCFQLSIVYEGVGDGSAKVLVSWAYHPAIRPLGQPNEVELRAGDTLLEGYVNGALVTSAYDTVLGYGTFGWRCATLDAPARTLFTSLEVVLTNATTS